MLVLQFYHGRLIWVHNVKRKWELTGGKLEPGETVIQSPILSSSLVSSSFFYPLSFSSFFYFFFPTFLFSSFFLPFFFLFLSLPSPSLPVSLLLLISPLPDTEQSFH
ncbi:hypothetical protein KW818_23840, partial [Enterobacter quasiroggenkampii]|nr:hypothetical protein [Enterobacter quasiroggenkampii]